VKNTTSDEYSTPHLAASSPVSCWGSCLGGGTTVQVEGVNLLGVCVTAHAVLNAAEHERRVSAGLGAVTDPALLDRLLDLPLAVPVADTVTWAEMSDQCPGVVDRDDDGATVTRLLEPPLTINHVVLAAAVSRELAAVQDASLFAGFTRRWIAVARDRVPDAAVLEAKLCGVGILDRCGRVLLAGEVPAALTIDGWTWLLQEKTYRRWLNQQSRDHGPRSPSPATGEASATQGQ
jgi:hypothetical protein